MESNILETIEFNVANLDIFVYKKEFRLWFYFQKKSVLKCNNLLQFVTICYNLLQFVTICHILSQGLEKCVQMWYIILNGPTRWLFKIQNALQTKIPREIPVDAATN